MDNGELKAANAGKDHLYNMCKDNQDNEPGDTTTPAPKRTKEEVFNLFLDQFLKDLAKYELRQDLNKSEIGICNYL